MALIGYSHGVMEIKFEGDTKEIVEQFGKETRKRLSLFSECYSKKEKFFLWDCETQYIGNIELCDILEKISDGNKEYQGKIRYTTQYLPSREEEHEQLVTALLEEIISKHEGIACKLGKAWN